MSTTLHDLFEFLESVSYDVEWKETGGQFIERVKIDETCIVISVQLEASHLHCFVTLISTQEIAGGKEEVVNCVVKAFAKYNSKVQHVLYHAVGVYPVDNTTGEPSGEYLCLRHNIELESDTSKMHAKYIETRINFKEYFVNDFDRILQLAIKECLERDEKAK